MVYQVHTLCLSAFYQFLAQAKWELSDFCLHPIKTCKNHILKLLLASNTYLKQNISPPYNFWEFRKQQLENWKVHKKGHNSRNVLKNIFYSTSMLLLLCSVLLSLNIDTLTLTKNRLPSIGLFTTSSQWLFSLVYYNPFIS